MVYNKEKLNAIRFFLAQTSGDGVALRNKIIRMREFRTEAASRLYKNPFLTSDKEIYVLSKISEWADIVFPDKWELYATYEGISELVKAINHEPYTPAEDVGYEKRRAILQQCKADFLNTTKEDK